MINMIISNDFDLKKPQLAIKEYGSKHYGLKNVKFLASSNLSNYFSYIGLRVPSCLLDSRTITWNRNTNSLIFIAKYLMKSGLLNKSLGYLNSAILAINNKNP
jgi:isoprenylcysteine carboxyl methyltransferase (ICMT) family protein YpbQ